MTKSRLYYFNPDHDLALANWNKNFDPPRSARNFGLDLSCFPLWYAEKGSAVLASLPDQEWIKNMQTLFPQLSDISIESHPDFSSLDSVRPWGWNAAVCKYLSLQGVDDSLFPTDNLLDKIRDLSHRKTAIDALHFLHLDTDLSNFLPQAAQQLSANEVEDFVEKHGQAILKAPWSGSGKGLFWIRTSLTDKALGWCRNVASKQGCVIGEQMYNKVQDFAMEFKCANGLVSFVGYSLFETDIQGRYKSNLLQSDNDIIQLITKMLFPDILIKVQERLSQFIENEIAPFFTGYLGVDMFMYNNNNSVCLHPCVEINLRMTMGLVARLFHDNFVSPLHSGRFYVDYFPISEELFNDHIQREKAMPLKTLKGKIKQGYLSLAPINKKSHYRIRVEVDALESQNENM